MKKKITYIGQVQESECGLCCVAMIMSYYNQNISVKQLSKIIEVGRDGISLDLLGKIFLNFNYKVNYYEVSPSKLKSFRNKPIILFWKNNHFVVLEKVKKNYFYIIDPNFGRMKVNEVDFERDFKNIILVPDPIEPIQRFNQNENPFAIYKNFLQINKIKFLFVTLVTIGSYIVLLRIPMLIQSTIDSSLEESGNVSNPRIVTIIIALLIIYISIDILKNISMISLSANMDSFIYNKVIKKLFRVPYKFYLTRNSSDILYRLNLIKANREYFIETIIRSFFDILLVLLVCGMMLIISQWLFIYTILITLLMGIFLVFLKRIIVSKNKQEIIENTKLQSIEYETLSSMFYLKSTGQEKYVEDIIITQYSNSLVKFKERSFINNFYVSVINSFTFFGPMGSFLIGMSLFSKNGITLGEVMFIYILSSYYFNSITGVFSSLNIFGTMRNNLERIVDIVEEEDCSSLQYKLGDTVSKIDSLTFKEVSFKYPGQNNYVIEKLSFSIKRGEKVAIVGETGSGKSTIIGLVLGLYSPDKGEILINQVPLETIDRYSLKERMGFVPQNPYIYNKSIKDNILMNRELSEDRITFAAKKAQIHEEIMKMPMKYETMVSEFGNNISGGQKQRILLARAIANKPELLILDEATSSVDNLTEKMISDYLSADCTTQIIIAHRLSTIIEADQILVMENGMIKESGTHNELLMKKGLYQRMYEKEVSK